MKANKEVKSQLMTVKEVAACCNVSQSHIYRLTDRGAMPQPIKLGSASRYLKDEILDWINSGCPETSKKQGGN